MSLLVLQASDHVVPPEDYSWDAVNVAQSSDGCAASSSCVPGPCARFADIRCETALLARTWETLGQSIWCAHAYTGFAWFCLTVDTRVDRSWQDGWFSSLKLIQVLSVRSQPDRLTVRLLLLRTGAVCCPSLCNTGLICSRFAFNKSAFNERSSDQLMLANHFTRFHHSIQFHVVL